MMDQWLARKLLEQDRKIEAVSRGGIGIGNSSVTDGSLEVEGEHAISIADGGINYIAGPPPPKPTVPTLQAGVGSIFVTWDGQWAEANDEDEAELDTEAPLDFDRIEVHCSTDPVEEDWGDDTLQGEIKAKAGGTVMVKGGDVEDEVFVCLIGLSKAGEHGEASGTASVVIEGIDIAAITNELDAANVDLSNLNGDMFAADAEIDAAKIALKNVDLAVISTDDSTLADALSDARDLAADLANKAKADAIADAAGKDSALKTKIDGTIAQARTDLEAGISSAESRAKAEAKTLSDAARDAANTFTSTRVFGPTQIADNAITTAKLAAGSVEADKIKAGAVGAVAIAADSIEGRHVKARSLTADKILVGDFTNLFPDTMFQNPSGYGRWSVIDRGLEMTGTGAQSGTYFTATAATMKPGDTVYARFKRVDVSGSGGTTALYLEQRNSAGVRIGTDIIAQTNGAGVAEGTKTITREDTAYCVIGLFNQSSVNPDTRVRVTEIEFRRQVSATLIQDGAITTDKILADAITANKVAANAIGARAIAADAVEAGKIAANAITSREILANAITAEKIVGLAVTTEKLAALAVSADKIAANAVVAGKIAANAVTAGTIAALAVTADKIAANAVTADKIAANAVTAGVIKADAINGMKIVGAQISTSTGFPRVQLDTAGLAVYKSSAVRSFFADATTGDLSIVGDFATATSGNERVFLSNALWKSIDVTNGNTVIGQADGAGIRIGVDANSGLDIYHAAKSWGSAGYMDQAYLRGPNNSSRILLQSARETSSSATQYGTFAMIADGKFGRHVISGGSDSVNLRWESPDTPSSGFLKPTSEISTGSWSSSRKNGYISLRATSSKPLVNYGGYDGATIELNGEPNDAQPGKLTLATYNYGEADIDPQAMIEMWGNIDVTSNYGYVNNTAETSVFATGKNIRPLIVSYNGTGDSWLIPFRKGTTEWGYVGSTGAMSVDDFGVQSGSGKRLVLNAGTGAARMNLLTNGNITLDTSAGFQFPNIPAVNGTAVNVTSGGWFQKNTSSRRYKTDIRPADIENFDILSLEPKSFYFKDQKERWETPREEWGDYERDIFANGLQLQHGLIAEEVEAAGGAFAVNYNEDGLPESLNYGHFGVALIPIVRDLRDRITQLEEKLNA